MLGHSHAAARGFQPYTAPAVNPADRELLYRETVEQHYWDAGPWEAKVSPFGQSPGEQIGAKQQKACSETTSTQETSSL